MDDHTPAPSAWVKSTYSGGNGTCVEVADLPSGVAVRDSKLGDDSPVLAVPTAAFAAMIYGIKSGKLA